MFGLFKAGLEEISSGKKINDCNKFKVKTVMKEKPE